MTKIITKKNVARRTSYSERHIDRLVKSNLFPAPVKLNPEGSRIGWLESDLDEWLSTRERRVY